MAAIQKQVQMRDFLLFSLFCLSQISAVRSSSVESSHHISKRTVKHHGVGYGSSCTVKGSYCSCHYCRCDHGFIHCVKHGATAYHHGIGKNYCYGHMEGEHCHCDYCKCKHGYGEHGKHGSCGGGHLYKK